MTSRVRSQVHLVAQREALMRLNANEPAYTPLLCGWASSLGPAEREALQAYDTMVKQYIVTCPRPEKPQNKVH